ncbi:MAG: hypothetical protein ACI867_001240, partial [Glaciecola sp.]
VASLESNGDRHVAGAAIGRPPKETKVHTHPSRIALSALGLSLALSACGSSTIDTTPDPSPGSFAMCAQDVPDCNDTAAPPAGDCPTCDPDPQGIAEGEPTGDERMNPSITIVQGFAVDTPVVEMAPGSVQAPLRLFLQEAVVEGSTVTVSFSGGEAPCFVIDHAELTEDQDMVVLTVFAGQPDPDADCSSMSTSIQSVTVSLDAELGSRLLLDGSRMQGAQNA